ncbi:MAG: rhodanese-like domain-containing protein [Verrucomicrobiales bacterium]|nr:rhodanese-like domain-containing protein [Verrucomicrobiales bacterium]
MAIGALFLGLVFAVPGFAADPAATPKPEVRHVDAKGAKKLLAKEKNITVLDVRTPSEFADGHIADARNIDFNAPGFEAEVSKLDRNKTYLVHCAAGGRSTRSLSVLQRLGFKNVVHLDGGLNAWTKSGQPVTK